MKERPKRNEPPQFLSGWKEIANYLGKGVRTVQRYEREFGLPVRRPAGKPWGSVVATRAELDAWVYASPIRHEFRLSRLEPSEKYTALSKDIRHGLQRMGQLRDQMLALRADVSQSLGMLRNSLYQLRGGLSGNVFRGDRREDFLKPDEIDLLTLPPKYTKAS